MTYEFGDCRVCLGFGYKIYTDMSIGFPHKKILDCSACDGSGFDSDAITYYGDRKWEEDQKKSPNQ